MVEHFMREQIYNILKFLNFVLTLPDFFTIHLQNSVP